MCNTERNIIRQLIRCVDNIEFIFIDGSDDRKEKLKLLLIQLVLTMEEINNVKELVLSDYIKKNMK